MSTFEIRDKDKHGNPFTAKTIIEEFLPTNEYWWDNEAAFKNEWIFRGQGNSEWSLLPVAWRSNNSNILIPFFDHLKYYFYKHFRINALSFNDWQKNVNDNFYDIKYYLWTQSFIISEFSKECNRLGLPINDNIPKFDIYNLGGNSLNKKFKEHFFSIINSDDTFIAQHHGIPTPLLDWSKNPLIALFFAVQNLHTNPTNEYFSVFALKSNLKDYTINNDENETPKTNLYIKFIEQKNHLNKYLHSQLGTFTCVTGNLSEFYNKNKKFPSLEEVINCYRPWNSDNKKPLLVKYKLHAKEASRILILLERLNINLSHLMPTHDNAAKTVMERFNTIYPLIFNT